MSKEDEQNARWVEEYAKRVVTSRGSGAHPIDLLIQKAHCLVGFFNDPDHAYLVFGPGNKETVEKLVTYCHQPSQDGDGGKISCSVEAIGPEMHLQVSEHTGFMKKAAIEPFGSALKFDVNKWPGVALRARIEANGVPSVYHRGSIENRNSSFMQLLREERQGDAHAPGRRPH